MDSTVLWYILWIVWYAEPTPPNGKLCTLLALRGAHPTAKPTGGVCCLSLCSRDTEMEGGGTFGTLITLLLHLQMRGAAAESSHVLKRCQEYVAAGYCSMDHTSSYMAKHCAGLCSNAAAGSGEGEPASQEDSACAKWAEEGYCTNEQFSAYMSRSCPITCGISPESTLGASSSEPAGHEGEGEDEDEAVDTEEGEEDEVEDDVEDYAASSEDDSDATGSGEEPENCVGWARQV